MDIIKLTTAESEAVERAYYEAVSYESVMAVVARQINARANPEAAEIYRHYADLCRQAQMRLTLAQNLALAPYVKAEDRKGVQYLFDFVREEARPVESKEV